MSIFVNDETVIQIGSEYLRVVGVGYLTFIVFNITNGIINGTGKTMATMIISLISLCLIRIPLAAFLSNTELGLRGIWIAIVISFVITTVNSLAYYCLGKWNQGRIDKSIPKQVEFANE